MELFARIGSEYIAILSPKNNISSSKVPIKYSSLNLSGKDAVENLEKVYREYFNTSDYSWVVSYWDSQTQLNSLEAKISKYATNLNNEEQNTRVLINQYYRWPTRGRYYTANNAIAKYNAMVSTYNSYVNTYNKIYNKLDSERAISSSSYLNL